MLRYQEKQKLHQDFHGATNTTLKYIARKYGVECLKMILRKTGHDVYRSIREKLAAGDTSELIEHLNWFYTREGADFILTVLENEIQLEVKECPVIRQLKKLGLEASEHVCLQTSEVNAGMCDGTPWKSFVKKLAPGHCVQIFQREEQA